MNQPNAPKTALFISPHLDDVVFSCGGTLAKMAAAGWHTILCTVFTKSVPDPQGFALACQLDKNLGPEVDYLKLRRAEDNAAAKILNVAEVLHLNFPEAPRRGYDSAAELFAGLKPNDAVWQPVAEYFSLLGDLHRPAAVFAPQGLGNHCDHLQTIDAVLEVFDPAAVTWYYNTPYIIRQPEARRYHRLPAEAPPFEIDISGYLEAKIEASAQYASQIGFQFGGRGKLRKSLTGFHLAPGNHYVEKFLTGATFSGADRGLSSRSCPAAGN